MEFVRRFNAVARAVMVRLDGEGVDRAELVLLRELAACEQIAALQRVFEVDNEAWKVAGSGTDGGGAGAGGAGAGGREEGPVVIGEREGDGSSVGLSIGIHARLVMLLHGTGEELLLLPWSVAGVIGDTFGARKGLANYSTAQAMCGAENGMQLYRAREWAEHHWLLVSKDIGADSTPSTSTAGARKLASADIEDAEESAMNRLRALAAEGGLDFNEWLLGVAAAAGGGGGVGGGGGGGGDTNSDTNSEASSDTNSGGEDESYLDMSSWESCMPIQCERNSERCTREASSVDSKGNASMVGVGEAAGGVGAAGRVGAGGVVGAETTCCVEVLTQLLSALTSILTAHGLQHLLFYGALLGQARNGSVTKHAVSRTCC
jgi:hypothetical protein